MPISPYTETFTPDAHLLALVERVVKAITEKFDGATHDQD